MKKKAVSTGAEALYYLWVLAFLFYIFGGRSTYLFPAVIWMTALISFFGFFRSSQINQNFLSFLRARVKMSFVLGFVAACSLSVYLANWFQLESFDGTLWDLGAYIQATYRGAVNGVSEVTITDQVLNANRWHFSISIPILSWIYRIFS